MDPVLVADELTLRVARGDECRVPVVVHNPGGSADHYRMEVLGDAARWSRVEPRRVPDVPAGGRFEVGLVLRPPADALPGSTPFAVRCVSLQDAERCAVLEGEAVVGASRDVEVTTAAVAPSGSRSGRYLVRVRNHGSAASDVRLSVADPRHELAFSLVPQELSVPAGGSGTAYLSVRPRRPRLAGRTLTHRFSVEDRSGTGAADRLPVRFDQRPVLGPLTAAAAAVLAAVLVAGAGLLAWPSVRGLLPRADPAAGTPAVAAPSGSPPAVPDGLTGSYVLWSATSVDDITGRADLDNLVTTLEGEGVRVRLVDSRTTAGLGNPAQPVLAVVTDGLPDQATAATTCALHRKSAPTCTAQTVG